MGHEIPDELLSAMAERFRMLGDRSRLAILRALMRKEQSVNEIVKVTGQSQANVSKHLRQLNDQGMVARRKVGLQVFYRVSDPLIEKICRLVCDRMRHSLQNASKPPAGPRRR